MHLAEMAWKSGMRGSDLTAVNKGFQIPQSIKKNAMLLQMALSSLESDINQMSERCLEIKRTLQKVLIKFGEPPDTDSQELFACVREFLDNFKKSLPRS